MKSFLHFSFLLIFIGVSVITYAQLKIQKVTLCKKGPVQSNKGTIPNGDFIFNLSSSFSYKSDIEIAVWIADKSTDGNAIMPKAYYSHKAAIYIQEQEHLNWEVAKWSTYLRIAMSKTPIIPSHI